MQFVDWDSGLNSSVLGLGCASMLGAVGKRESQAAIQSAIELGINHFDLARSYGYGEAERFVGQELRASRDKVIIATKFGIYANWRARALRPLKPVVRYLKRGKSGQSSGQEAASGVVGVDRFHGRLSLTSANMIKSLEASLRALRTDYVDLLMIHEPQGRVENWEELIAGFDRLKTAGKIRASGVAFNWQQFSIAEHDTEAVDICQFNCSPLMPHYPEAVALRGAKANILFSPFQGSLKSLSAGDILRTLRADFANSVVLCRMFQRRHQEENLAAIQGVG